jgi:hypothetical protein
MVVPGFPPPVPFRMPTTVALGSGAIADRAVALPRIAVKLHLPGKEAWPSGPRAARVDEAWKRGSRKSGRCGARGVDRLEPMPPFRVRLGGRSPPRDRHDSLGGATGCR